jgi:hypothetical protein
MKNLKIALFCIAIATLTSCSNTTVNIPSGFKAKLLTPTGFDDKILDAGQADIGEVSSNGQYTSLVLLEATSITIKESFGQSAGNKDGEDHRVMTKTTPLTVDIYVQMSIPKDKNLINNAFASVTSIPYAGSGDNQNRVSVIYLKDVYEKFAQMTVRGKVRGIFSKYQSWDSVMVHFDKINAEIGLMVMDVFKNANVPLDLVSVQLSNVKEDETIWASKNEQQATLSKINSINALGKAMRDNPGYIEVRKWEVLEKIVSSPNAARISLIVSDDKQKPVITIPSDK